MTQKTAGRRPPGEPVRRCRWCQAPLPAHEGPGRPRAYCRQSCRQRDYEARQRAVERGLDEGEIIMTRARLDELNDRLWVLSCAIHDVDGDLARAGDGADGSDGSEGTDRADGADYRAALAWLLDAARPLVVDIGR